MSNNTIFEIKNLVKDFPALRAVDDVSLTIHKGEAVFIVGPSGSGKSTVLRCLNFLEKPTSGEIIFNGSPVGKTERELDAYRAKAGIPAFQSVSPFDDQRKYHACAGEKSYHVPESGIEKSR